MIYTGKHCKRCGVNEYYGRYNMGEWLVENILNEEELCNSCQIEVIEIKKNTRKINYDKHFSDNKQLNNDNHYDN